MSWRLCSSCRSTSGSVAISRLRFRSPSAWHALRRWASLQENVPSSDGACRIVRRRTEGTRGVLFPMRRVLDRLRRLCAPRVDSRLRVRGEHGHSTVRATPGVGPNHGRDQELHLSRARAGSDACERQRATLCGAFRGPHGLGRTTRKREAQAASVVARHGVRRFERPAAQSVATLPPQLAPHEGKPSPSIL